MSDTDWTVRQIDGVLLIGPVGPLDGITASRARARFVSAIDDVAVVVVDLTEVDFVDSAGLGLLVGVARSVRERGGVLALAVPRAGVRSMLADAGFGRIAVMAPTAEEAMTALASWRRADEGFNSRPAPPPPRYYATMWCDQWGLGT